MNNYERLKIRAQHANNDRQKDSMVRDKQRSLHRALLYSYQAGWIKKDGVENAEWCRALINPDKLKFDYDEKLISVDFKHGFTAGDTFEWPKDSGTHWIILQQELTELAYFRGNIRRCQYLTAIDPETKEKVGIWCAVRGPVETKINSIQKAGIVAHVPNLTLDIYMPNTDQNRRMFDRYFRFEFADRFWMVQAPDSISTPGILEFTAEEDYNCNHDELIGGKIDPNPPVEDEREPEILGETFIKPLQEVTYTSTIINSKYKWSITSPSENKDIHDMLNWKVEDNKLIVTWIGMISGQFVVNYGPYQKIIVVESLF